MNPPVWFSRAAIEQAAHCVSVVAVPSGDSVASALLARYAEEKGVHGLASRLFPDALWQALIGDLDFEAANEFYGFAGLLELGARVGYLKLEDWDESKLFHETLKSFAERESASDNPADLTLINALLERLGERKSTGEKRDKSAFYAFASFLHLEGAIREDQDVRQFLAETSRGLQPDDDLGFLLGPQTFAEAIVEGAVGGVKSEAPRGGLATLGYFEWLADILKRVENVEGLAEIFVRQARWCHDSEKVRTRISIWATRMSEWSQSGEDPAGEAAWRAFEVENLYRIQRLVDKVRPRVLAEQEGVRGDEVVAEVDALQLQMRGRIGAARRKARYQALSLRDRLREAKGEEEVAELRWPLLLACKTLADVGDATGAAVILAPFEQLLGEEKFFQNLMTQAAGAEAGSVQEERKAASWQTPLEPPEQQSYSSAE